MPDPLTITADIAGIVSAAIAIAALYLQLRKPKSKPDPSMAVAPIILGARIEPGAGLGFRYYL